jgi:hypothetical protein
MSQLIDKLLAAADRTDAVEDDIAIRAACLALTEQAERIRALEAVAEAALVTLEQPAYPAGKDELREALQAAGYNGEGV